MALSVLFGWVQYNFLRAPFPSDSIAYLQWAAAYPDVELTHGPLRVGLILPVKLAIEIFSYSEFAYYSIPLLSGLLLVLSTYAIGRRLLGIVPATLATAVFISTPVFLENSSMIVPDPIATGLFCGAIALLLRVSGTWGQPGSLVAYRATLLAAGALLGWTYLVREYSVLLLVLIPVIFMLGKLPRRDLPWVAIPVAATPIMESIFNAVMFGRPFARLQATVGHLDPGGRDGAVLEAFGEGTTRLDAFLRFPSELAASALGPALLVGFLAAVIAVAMLRDRGLALLLAWVASLYIPLCLASGGFDPAHPALRTNHLRYWFLLLPAMYLLVFGAGAAIISRLPARTGQMVAAPVVAVVMFILVLANFRQNLSEEYILTFRAAGATQLPELREWLLGEGQDVDVLWVDRRMSRVLPLYTRTPIGREIWDGTIRAYESQGRFASEGELRSGGVVVHQLGLNYLRNRDLVAPPHITDPGQGWRTAVRRADGTLHIFAPSATS